jgi:hypothetical protein
VRTIGVVLAILAGAGWITFAPYAPAAFVFDSQGADIATVVLVVISLLAVIVAIIEHGETADDVEELLDEIRALTLAIRPPPVPVVVSCRKCGTVPAPGQSFCARCGAALAPPAPAAQP